MLLRGDRKSSWRVVWKDNALGIRQGWYYDAHRKRINGRSRRWRRIWVNRRKFQQEDQEEPGNVSKTVTLFLFDFEFLTYEYISWPDMYTQRTFDEDRHENPMFSLSLVDCFFFLLSSFRFPANKKQSTLWRYLCARMSEFTYLGLPAPQQTFWGLQALQ